MTGVLLTVRVLQEADVVGARQRARQVARLLGFDEQDQVRFATAVSELARNVHQYARQGSVEFSLEGDAPPQALVVRVSDQGPGIPHLDEVLAGAYRSPTGMGLGLLGARRLVDRFSVEAPAGGGTTVRLEKRLPPLSPLVRKADLARLAGTLAAEAPGGPLAEIQQQNHELLGLLDDVRRRQEDLVRLNRELEDTNRGVVALYAELDERAEHLRRADEMKSRFLSNMSHEFRTPLNSILAISKLLQDHADGPLTAEQEKQVGFIRKAAQDLSELVNDLLDLARVEAGKTVVRPAEFHVSKLFGALRGMLRPLLATESVRLVFEEAEEVPILVSDEAKVSQILRNFISNALKFTERGEIRVSARREGPEVVFAVADTGIGIALEDQERIFQEFGQVENPLQKKFKGTGLGLALSRRLAELLGGRIMVESEPGRGSTFRLAVPLRRGPGLPCALVVDDEEVARYAWRALLREVGFEVREAAGGEEALRGIEADPPDVILIDLVMPDRTGKEVLEALRRSEETRALPVVVGTSKLLGAGERGELEALGAAVLSKEVLGRRSAAVELREALARAGWRGGASPRP